MLGNDHRGDHDRRHWYEPVRTPLLVGVLLAVGMFFFMAIPLMPGPEWMTVPATLMLVVATFFGFPAMLGILLSPILLVAWLIRPFRRRASRGLVWTMATVAPLIVAMIAVGAVRDQRMDAVVLRAQPLVDAIETYRATVGSPPASLDELSSVPDTGLLAYPAFSYRLADSRRDPFKHYELFVECPLGLVNWDVLVYWPEGNYPTHMYGGYVSRHGEWAYVNE